MDSPGAVAARRWSRGKRAGVAAIVVAAALLAGALADSLLHLRPIIAERLWIAALNFGVTPLQEEAVFRLRNYPTRPAAVALVRYIGARSRSGDLKSAGRATETLCILSGRSFGTSFREHARGHFWRAPEPGEWPDLLARIDEWAGRTLRAAP